MSFTEKSRLKAALAGEEADRSPVICPGGMMSAATTTVLKEFAGSFHTDPLVMAQVAEAIRSHTGFENLGVPFCMTVEAEVFGSTVDMGDAGVEPCVTRYGAEQLDSILDRPLPDPAGGGRSAVILGAIQELSARNQEVPIIGNLTGPISLATSIMDPLIFFRLMRKKPAEVQSVLDYLTDYLVTFARNQVAAGADAIAIADPTATGEIIGGANFRRFAIPLLSRLIREIERTGAGAIVHICGDATVLLDSLNELDGAAFSFDSIVNLAKAKSVLANKPVMGNINTQMLHTGEPQRIRQYVNILLQQDIDIIAPACGISLATPQANLKALTGAVKG
ncbi:uroporphyrinogen decarboxylase family protein [Sporomusa aerivorans]|uniref:uroporphyrinogen decarboxylase family protein n=1 Tax=Sporomusa aerivorans TaxID=204936 RepID=UPI00352B4636